MKKLIFILFAILLFTGVQSQTLHVKTHDKVTIFTDPSKGAKSFVQWGVFPEEGKEIRRIVMHLTLAYPEDRAIAHWDYMDRVKILRKGGVNGENINFEMGRMLTPYGSNFKEDWSYTWSVDVTDFHAFLRDSTEIQYIHTGYESPKLGWDLSIEFEITFGPAVADFISAEKLWDGNFQYGNPENDIENQLKATQIQKEDEAGFGRFRIQHTGHGMEQPSGCSEFCSRWRELIFDGKVVDHRDMWKDCGNNPLYPQGGTWIFDRAYWCPGDLQEPDIIDIPLTKSNHELDLNMEPFTATNINQPKEQITSFFFQYAAPNHRNDVRIEEIIAPNSKDNYNRFNPRGFNPLIRIRNLGSETLKSLDIIYGTEGFAQKTFHWEGELDFYQTALISLPGIIDAKKGTNTFAVVLDAPNQNEDEWDLDNSMESIFEDIPTLPTNFVVDFMTNNKPEHNWIHIVNSKNDTVFSKTPEMLEPATKYFDTLQLVEDNYYLHLVDTAGEGLEFWFMAKAGYGRLRLKDTEGNLIHLFESDNGNGQFYSFRTDSKTKVDTSVSHLSVNIYPRMVTDYVTIYTTTNKSCTLKVIITKDGEYVETHEYTNIRDAETGLDLKHLAKGRYVMEIYVDGEHKMNRRFNKR